jgi:hypothetical protein
MDSQALLASGMMLLSHGALVSLKNAGDPYSIENMIIIVTLFVNLKNAGDPYYIENIFYREHTL